LLLPWVAGWVERAELEEGGLKESSRSSSKSSSEKEGGAAAEEREETCCCALALPGTLFCPDAGLDRSRGAGEEEVGAEAEMVEVEEEVEERGPPPAAR
jgi:hypothetical protein